jgi:hypothetical protein
MLSREAFAQMSPAEQEAEVFAAVRQLQAERPKLGFREACMKVKQRFGMAAREAFKRASAQQVAATVEE